METENIYDLIIIGAGPAGLSAAIYASRANLSYVVIDKAPMAGGQILNTDKVDNYLGMNNVDGFDMGMQFVEHAKSLGATILSKTVSQLDIANDIKLVMCKDNTILKSKNIIYATGCAPSKLNVPGEEELRGRGVSYCATCDGGFYRNKTVAVVGGGDTALSEAKYLSNICEKVYLIHRRDEFRANGKLIDKVLDTDNIEVLWNTVVEEIQGEDKVTGLSVLNTQLDMPGTILVDGVFIATGSTPLTELLQGQVDMDDRGYVIAGENCATNCLGVYVAGDIRKKYLKQLITAASDGANAVNSLISSTFVK